MDNLQELRDLVSELEAEHDEKKQIKILLDISELLLTEYEVHISDGEIIEPLRVEAYYYPYRTPNKFNDPCAHPSSKKIGVFGKLYFIESQYGYPGVDLCLSLGDYFLSFLIKNSHIGDKFFKQMDLFDRFQGRWQEIEQAVVLRKKSKPLSDSPVFHTSRIGLKENRTKFAHEMLASVIEIQRCKYDWEKGYGKLWTVANYLAEHDLKADDDTIIQLLGNRSNEVKLKYEEIVKA